MKVLIVGAGVAGLAIGWRLAEAGVEVEILERGLAGRGATWASAGMIAPGAELGHETSAMAAFAREARRAWPGFAAELEAQSGHAISYRESGSLRVAESAERGAALQAEAAALAREGVEAVWLPPAAMREAEPLLSAALFGALRIADDAQVDNRALTDALGLAARNAGAQLRENCAVQTLSVQDWRVRAVVTAEGTLAADHVVVACGAWMNLLGGLDAGALPPVRPAKGQMIACVPPEGTALPNALVWSDEVYLVPRKDRLFIGATVEDASFDTSISREARDRLIGAAKRLIPSLSRWRVSEMWAGLRPRTPDDAPVLGATPVLGLYVASGQFRNGILFAPMVAATLTNLILGRSGAQEGAAFDPRRFGVS